MNVYQVPVAKYTELGCVEDNVGGVRVRYTAVQSQTGMKDYHTRRKDEYIVATRVGMPTERNLGIGQ